MLLLIPLILELGISDIRLVFQFGDLFIRLVDALFPMMTEMPSSSLRGDLRFMPASTAEFSCSTSWILP